MNLPVTIVPCISKLTELKIRVSCALRTPLGKAGVMFIRVCVV